MHFHLQKKPRFQEAFFLLLLILSFLKTSAQQGSPTSFCGTTAKFVSQFGIDTTHHDRFELSNTVPQSSFEAQAIDTCGKFRVFYEDLLSTNPHVGFGDPTLGATRRSTYCAVLSYIQSVFDFSNIPSSDLICLYVAKSYAPSAGSLAPRGTTFYAEASPYYIIPSGGGVVNGYVNDYMRSGSNPNPGSYHACIMVNFDSTYSDDTSKTTVINYQNDYTATFVNCNVDLFSTLLHETTHAMGWLSLLQFLPTTGAYYQSNMTPSFSFPNVVTSLDTAIYVGSVYPSTSLTKLIGAGYTINTGTNANNNYWLNNKPAPDNYPVLSGNTLFPSSTYETSTPGLTGSYGSHLDDQMMSYSVRQRISPGDNQNYVMGPSGAPGRLFRTYTKAELLSIAQILHINFTSSFSTANASMLSNHTPFSKKMAGYASYFSDSIELFPDTVTHDYQMVNNGGSLTINLYNDNTLTDADGDSIHVMPGTLINFRGCGNGGNNHAQLTLSNNNKTITYTPRANFFGRAQFGFSAWDGKEKGSYVIYTIDVAKGSNVSYTPGNNMVLNGDFEEGTETRTVALDTIPNTTDEYYYIREGKMLGINFSDSHPFDYFTNPKRYGAGIMVHNAHIECIGTHFTSEAGSTAWPAWVGGAIDNPSGAPTGGERYQMFAFDSAFYSLYAPVKKCNHYTLEFDAVLRTGASPQSFAFTIGFADTVIGTGRGIGPSLKYYFDTSINLSASWQHITIPFWYCGADSAKLLNIISHVLLENYVFLDNISLKQDLTPPSLTATINATRQSSCMTLLTPVISNGACNITHKWSTGATTATISVSSNTSGTYRDTISDGCRTYVATTSVTAALAVASISGGTTPICAGQSTTLTASPTTAGFTFQWTNGGTNIPGATASTYAVTTTGTYYVKVSDPYGCQAIAPGKSITVNTPPSASITQGASVSICTGSTLNLSANTGAGIAYQWLKGGTVRSGATSSAYSETGLGVGSYTYKVIETAGGCADTSSATTVTVGSNACGAGCVFSGASYNTPSSITSSITGTPTTRNYYISSNINIGTGSPLTINLRGLVVFIAPGVKINVVANTTLLIDSCHFFCCPGNRWAGFRLNANTVIGTGNYTMIEQADTAIYQNSSSQYLSVNNTTFNENVIGICVSGIANPASNQCVVQNSIFSLRDFSGYSGYPGNWPRTSALNTLVSRTYSYQPPYVVDRDYPVGSVTGRSPVGIYIFNTGTTTVSGGAYSFTELPIGDASSGDRNIFDTYTGLSVVNSNVASVNNAYMNAINAVDARGSSSATENRLRVYQPSGGVTNDFYLCQVGLYIADYTFLVANKMNMYQGSKSYFNFGIQQVGKSYHSIDINNNYFNFLSTGISETFGGKILQAPAMTISIANNQMVQCDSGIALNNAFTCWLCNRLIGTDPYGTVTINNNTITTAYNGIIMNGVNFPNSSIYSNHITLTDLTGQSQYGIKAVGAWLNINNDSVSHVGATPATNSQMRGYYLASSPTSYVGCNAEAYTGTGFEFEGNSNGLRWLTNSMYENQKGMVISTGLIGKQFYLTSNPSGNRWGLLPTNPSAWVSGHQTYTQNFAKATNSPLFVNSSSIENPTNNGTSVPGFPDTTSYNTSGALILAGGPTECTPTNHNGNVSYITAVQNKPVYATDQIVNTWKAQLGIYHTLLGDHSLSDTSYILQDFYSAAATSRYALLSNIERYIAYGYTDSAQALIDAGMSASSPGGPDGYGVEVVDYSDADAIVNNYLTFYQIGIDYMNDDFAGDDIDNLFLLAGSCPMTSGDVVYQARALYSVITGISPFWDDDPCLPMMEHKQSNQDAANVAGISAKTGKQAYTLYPNPNNGKVSLIQQVGDTKLVKAILLNSKGQAVYQNMLQFQSKTARLDMKNLIPGLYLLHLIDSDGIDYVLNFIVDE